MLDRNWAFRGVSGLVGFFLAALFISLIVFNAQKQLDLNKFQANTLSLLFLSPVIEEIIRRIFIRTQLKYMGMSAVGLMLFAIFWAVADALLKIYNSQDANIVFYVISGFIPVLCLHSWMTFMSTKSGKTLVLQQIFAHFLFNFSVALMLSRIPPAYAIPILYIISLILFIRLFGIMRVHPSVYPPYS